MWYLIAQIIGFIAFVVSLTAYHRNKKENILKTMLMSNVLELTHYLLLGAYSGCITKVIAILRNFFIILKEKYKKLNSNIFLIVFIVVYIIAGILAYSNIFSVLPILAAVIYLISIWNGNEVMVKKSAFYCYFLWLIYNIFVFSISGVVSNVVSIISTFIAVKNYKKIDCVEQNFDSTE